MMRLETINNLKQFELLEKEWDALLEKSDQKSIFLSWEWLYLWWINFRKGKELAILTVRDDHTSELIGVAPFYEHTTRLFCFITIKRIKWLGAEKVGSTFMDFIIMPGYKERVLKLVCNYFKENKDKWDLIELNEVNDFKETLGLLEYNLSDNATLFHFLGHRCIYIDLPSSYEKFLMSLGRHTRRNVRKATRDIDEKFKIKLIVDTDYDHAKKNLDTVFFLHESRFCVKSKSESNFSAAEVKKFHYQVAMSLSKKNRVKMFFLDYENKPIACLYTFQYKDALFCYQSGLDPHWAKWSLGDAIFGLAIEDSIKHALGEFHFLIGDHEYKKHWSKTTRETQNIMIMKRNIIGRLFYYQITTKKRFRNIMKKI